MSSSAAGKSLWNSAPSFLPREAVSSLWVLIQPISVTSNWDVRQEMHHPAGVTFCRLSLGVSWSVAQHGCSCVY